MNRMQPLRCVSLKYKTCYIYEEKKSNIYGNNKWIVNFTSMTYCIPIMWYDNAEICKYFAWYFSISAQGRVISVIWTNYLLAVAAVGRQFRACAIFLSANIILWSSQYTLCWHLMSSIDEIAAAHCSTPTTEHRDNDNGAWQKSRQIFARVTGVRRSWPVRSRRNRRNNIFLFLRSSHLWCLNTKPVWFESFRQPPTDQIRRTVTSSMSVTLFLWLCTQTSECEWALDWLIWI